MEISKVMKMANALQCLFPFEKGKRTVKEVRDELLSSSKQFVSNLLRTVAFWYSTLLPSRLDFRFLLMSHFHSVVSFHPFSLFNRKCVVLQEKARCLRGALISWPMWINAFSYLQQLRHALAYCPAACCLFYGTFSRFCMNIIENNFMKPAMMCSQNQISSSFLE